MTTNKQVYEVFAKYYHKKCYDAISYCRLSVNASWCDAMVTYAFYKAGGKNLYCNGARETYCPHSIEWCKAHLAQIPMYLAMRGDVIFFDWNKNNVPDHVGIVKDKINTAEIETIEGNTSGGIVDDKERPVKYVLGIFRPHYEGSKKLCKLETETGDFGYVSIANLQKALKTMGLYTGPVEGVLGKNTVKALQKACGATPDGAWGVKTSKKIQKMIGVTADGEFGMKSVIALKKWINNKNYPAVTKPVEKPATTPVSKPTENKASKLVTTANKLAWPLGTAKKKYAFKTGAPTSAMKTAMKKRGYTNKEDDSDCGYVLNTVIYVALGIKTKVLGAVNEPFPEVEGFKVVWEGKKIPKGFLKAGMIICYKKKKKKKITSQHALMYMGDNNIAEGGRGIRFFVIKHFKFFSKAKFHKSNVAISTLRVLEVKE